VNSPAGPVTEISNVQGPSASPCAEGLAGADPCSLGSAISRRDLWESSTDNKKPRTYKQVRATIAHLSRLVERYAAGEHTRAKALPEDGPFGGRRH
jgi:hypothetical protein